ncbi:hypothetical protein [Sorangium sp. So ce1389]|uniref:hypothetical protein n=1 Tax=Sorangium sp. So ce1389 TaxID=3133336 RepID=UPI003F61E6D6
MVSSHEQSSHDVEHVQLSTTEGEQLALGQKRLILAIVVSYIGSRIGAEISVWMAVCVAVASVALIADGVLKIGRALRWSTSTRAISLILMLVPLVNLITLLWVNSSATKGLRRAGYRVGLFGASR